MSDQDAIHNFEHARSGINSRFRSANTTCDIFEAKKQPAAGLQRVERPNSCQLIDKQRTEGEVKQRMTWVGPVGR
jgi:hypothetical protein